MKIYRNGAVGALLDIYEQAISDFKKNIADIPDQVLTFISDAHTIDENCKSLQSILSHVIDAGFGYATSIINLRENVRQRPDKTLHSTIAAYLEDLSNMFSFTETVLKEITDRELEASDLSRKIKTNWGQYSIEQMAEHAIVHILRHSRQIERIKHMYSFVSDKKSFN